MIVHKVFENETINLDEEQLSIVKAVIDQNPELPIIISDNGISFRAYTVGRIQIGDIVIDISPRNSSFNMKTIFEMITFVDMDIFRKNLPLSGFEFEETFGISAITSNFCKICTKLLMFGLTGEFVKEEETSKILKGQIVAEKFSKYAIPLDGISYVKEHYMLDTTQNRIIKTALIKLIQYEENESFLNELYLLLRDFDYVKEFQGSIQGVWKNIKSVFSANPHYPLALEYAIKILCDMKLTYSNGKLCWYSFLQNSNSLFESYIRKILKSGLNEKIDKWNKPKKYATIRYKELEENKYFSPDILINYNDSTNECKVVLDVKNKNFNLLNRKFGEIIESADIYQILFYCRTLNSKLGGLIYPSSCDFQPAHLMVDDKKDLRIVIFSVNMKDSFENRYSKLVSEVKRELINYS